MSEPVSESRARWRRALGCLLALWLAPLVASGDEGRKAEPRGEVTLAGALAAALLGHEEFERFSGEIRVREARALQAGLLPNPELLVELENVAGSGDFSGTDRAETTLLLGQRIELGGKRSGRRRLAEQERALASWDYELARADVVARVAVAFAQVLADQERRALVREQLTLAEQGLPPAAGDGPAEVERVQAELASVWGRIELRRAESELAASRLRLAALWGGREPHFERALGDLREVQPPPALPDLLAGLDASPALARWADEIERHEAQVALEGARGLPDVMASAGVRRFEESDDGALVVGLHVPFPVFDRNQGERRAARQELANARHGRSAARTQLETALRLELFALSASFAEFQALRGEALPRLERVRDLVRDGHARGRLDRTDWLEAEGALFDLRSQELAALLRYHAAAAEIARLTGAQPRSLRARR